MIFGFPFFFQPVIIPIKLDYNAVVVNIQCGKNTIPFEIDTGSQTSVITSDIAKEINAPNEGNANSYGVSSSFSSYFTTFKGNINNDSYIINGLVDTGEYKMKYPLLGMDFFVANKLDFMIDIQDQSLILWKQPTVYQSNN